MRRLWYARSRRDDAGAVRAAPRAERAGIGGSRRTRNAELTCRAARATEPGPASDIGPNEWTDRGVVAQLGEHLHGMQGVGGSSPPSSTTSHRSSSGGTAKRPFVLTAKGHVVLFGAPPMIQTRTDPK